MTYSLHTTPRTLPSADSESYAYDENGNVEGVTQAKLTSTGVVQETTTREYDVLDRLETETRYDTKVTGYEYDLKGNRTKVTDFQNVATTYTFDEQDRLETAVTAEGTTTYGYFADGLPKSTAFFNDLHEGRCYDAACRLTGLVTARAAIGDACTQASYVSRHRYTHDAEGNCLTQVEEVTVAGGTAVGSAETTEYGYDEESRLVGVRYPDDTAALYQLDAVGNRVGERKAASSMVPALTAAAFLAMSPAALTNDVVAAFNRADWLESVTDSRAPAKDATFEWDAAGNLKRQQTAGRDRRFTWDVKQTLTKVEDDGIEAGRYDYGADGLRSKRVTSLESVEYVLDGMQVLVETDGATSGHPAKRRYTYAANALAVTDITGSTRTTQVLHLDALGSPVTGTTQTGAVAVVRQYDAWGQYRNGTAPGSADAKLGYTGHQYDVETGLVYARARYYDAEYGRFLSRDSFEGQLNSAPSLHRFVYANANPLRYWDRDGHAVNLVAAGIGAAIGFGLGFGAGLLDGKSVGDAALVGLGGAAFGGLTGLTMGASLAGGATAWGATTAVAGKVAAGAALDASRQGLAMRADPNKKFSYSELAIASLALSGAPTGAAVGQLPSLARTYAAAGVVLGASGVAGGASEVKQAVETRNGNLALLGVFDILLGRAGIKGGAQGLKALEGVVAPRPEPVDVRANGATLKQETASSAARGDQGSLGEDGWQPPRLRESAPVVIPEDAAVVTQPKSGYTQVRYRWAESGERMEARWHTRTPGAPEEQGNTWVVTKRTPGNAQGLQSQSSVKTGTSEWTPESIWQKAVQAHQEGSATPSQQSLLERGHWKAPVWPGGD